jgi:hypothetical protein
MERDSWDLVHVLENIYSEFLATSAYDMICSSTLAHNEEAKNFDIFYNDRLFKTVNLHYGGHINLISEEQPTELVGNNPLIAKNFATAIIDPIDCSIVLEDEIKRYFASLSDEIDDNNVVFMESQEIFDILDEEGIPVQDYSINDVISARNITHTPSPMASITIVNPKGEVLRNVMHNLGNNTFYVADQDGMYMVNNKTVDEIKTTHTPNLESVVRPETFGISSFQRKTIYETYMQDLGLEEYVISVEDGVQRHFPFLAYTGDDSVLDASINPTAIYYPVEKVIDWVGLFIWDKHMPEFELSVFTPPNPNLKHVGKGYDPGDYMTYSRDLKVGVSM